MSIPDVLLLVLLTGFTVSAIFSAKDSVMRYRATKERTLHLTAYRSPDPKLEYPFDVDAFLEIKIRANSAGWTKVDPNAFRSWTGERRINGVLYDGPVYQYLTNELAKTA